MSRSGLLVSLALLLVLAGLPFVALTERVPRFTDEDTILLHGMAFVDLARARDPETRSRFRRADEVCSVGLPVSVWAGTLYRLDHDVRSSRLAMLAWAALFWFSILALLQATRARLGGPQPNPEPWVIVVTGSGAALIVQSIPYLWQNQIHPLGEVPGASALLLGFALLLARRWSLAAVLVGVAAVLKHPYLAYLPLLPVLRALDGDGPRVRASLRLALLACTPLAVVQVLRLSLLGATDYLAATGTYLQLFEELIATAGEERTLELAHHTWRVQVAWLVGTFGCAVLAVLHGRRARSPGATRDGWALPALALGGVILVGSLHWWLVGENQFWRRVLPFVVPGVAVVVTYVAARLLTLHARARRQAAAVGFAVLALLAVSTGSFGDTWRTTRPLPRAERRTLHHSSLWCRESEVLRGTTCVPGSR